MFKGGRNKQADNDVSFRTDPGVGGTTHESWQTIVSDSAEPGAQGGWGATPNPSWQSQGGGGAGWGVEGDLPPGLAADPPPDDAGNLEAANKRLEAENERLRKECLERENEMLRKQCEEANAQREAAEAQAKASEAMLAAMQGYTAATMGPNGTPMPMAGMPMMYPMMPGMQMQPGMMMPGMMMPGMMMPGMMPGQMPMVPGNASAGMKKKDKAEEKADIDDPPPVPGGGPATTLMLRNLPNDYTRDMMLTLLDEQGFKGAYDFFYMPIDFKSNAGLGYAFINLASAEQVVPFWEKFSGFSGWSLPSQKVCTVSWSNPHQGLATHIERFKNSFLMHEEVPDEHRPVLMQDGVRIDFPPPTRKLQPPRARQLGR